MAIKLKDLLKENEERGLSLEVKKHFLEIVSTYNKYQEQIERKSDIIEKGINLVNTLMLSP